MSTLKSIGANDKPVLNLHFLSKTTDQFVVCDKSNTLCVMNMQGQVMLLLNNSLNHISLN